MTRPKSQFSGMKVGQSIKVPAEQFQRAVSAARKYGLYHGWKFSVSSGSNKIQRVK